jgi:dipeptidyl aminopeptidase/acylaminoacyl peptidase
MAIQPDQFVAIDAAAAPVFSRDGQTLFYLRGSSLPQVWALALDTGAARQLTFHDEKVALIRRSPIDDRLIYGIDRGGDERQQLLLIDPNEPTPEPRVLTANHAVIHDWGGWSPDGTRIAYAANARDEAHFDIYLQDIASGVRECLFQGTNLVSVSGFRPDGAKLVLLHERGYGNMSLLLLDIASGETQEFPQPAPCNYQSLRWSSDGRTLLALTDHGNSEFMRLCRLDPETGDVTTIYQAPGRDVDAYAISSDAMQLATVENDRGYAVLRVGPIGDDRPAVANLPRGIVTEPTFAPDGAALAFIVAAPTRPPSPWLWRDGTAQPLWQTEPHVDPAGFVDFELVDWPSFDGTRIPGWFALPRGEMPKRGYPAIVWVHGGPVAQTRPNFRPDMQMLLAQGFAVLMPNVRGSSGYGRSYTDSDDVDRRIDSVTDLAHARHWLAAHPSIDAERIGIMGQSYGGFMVLSAITEHPNLWRAAVNYYGIADFVTLLAGTGAWRRNHRAAEYGDPDRDAQLFDRISPIRKVDRVNVPVLVAHGHRDPRVPIGESEQFVAALRERQKPVTYLTFDYAGHGFIRPDDRRRIYAAVAEFFTTHLC